MTTASKTGDKPAFPLAGEAWVNNDTPGMSIREYYAGQALAGIIAASPKSTDPRMVGREEQVIALTAIAFADALIAQLEKAKP